MARVTLPLLLLGLTSGARAASLPAQAPTAVELATASLPPWAVTALNDSSLHGRFDLLLTLNPFVVSGDFDADNRLDVAVAIRARASGKRGIVILSRAGRPVVLGAGIAFANGGDDFTWLDAWWADEFGHNRPVTARAQVAIHVEKMESASAWIYWDGRRYRWQQLGN